MEIFPYMFSVLLTALVIHWSRVNAVLKPGTKLRGLFRYRDNVTGPVARGWKPAAPDVTMDRR